MVSLMKTNFSSPKYSLCPSFQTGGAPFIKSIINIININIIKSNQHIIIIHCEVECSKNHKHHHHNHHHKNEVTDVGANKLRLVATIFSLSPTSDRAPFIFIVIVVVIIVMITITVIENLIVGAIIINS